MLSCRVVTRTAIAFWAHLLLVGLTHGLEVDPLTRNASQSFYVNAYLPSANVPMGWTGNHTQCNAGTTALEFREAVLDRVNYFRAMAGVPAEVALNETWSSRAQQAALIMSANNNLSHSPPASWMCYTSDGAMAASKSNLALGSSGTAAIDGYMKDPGAGNTAAAHRRWLLYPPTDEMGTGDVPRVIPYNQANALWVIDDSPVSPSPATRNPYVAWPSPGYVPYQIVYPRWSFSFKNANFSGASVSMTENGDPVSVALEPLSGGYGDNTLVWIPMGLGHSASWPRPTFDVAYQVTVNNVVIGGMPQSFSYAVTVFDPAVLPGDYNQNSIVDAADYSLWRNSLGQNVPSFSGADGNGDGTVNVQDYTVWKSNFGGVLGGSGASDALTSLPEPSALLYFLLATIVLSGWQRIW